MNPDHIRHKRTVGSIKVWTEESILSLRHAYALQWGCLFEHVLEPGFCDWAQTLITRISIGHVASGQESEPIRTLTP